MGGWFVDETADVVPLTNSNFQKFLYRTERVLVDFYAPWCNHCKSLEVEWNKAASELKTEGVSTRLAKMDAVGETVGGGYIVEGYPTIYFVNGKRVEHVKVDYAANAIASWVRKAEFAEVKELQETNVEGFMAGTKQGNFALVARVKKKSVRAAAYLKAFEELKGFNATIFKGGVVWLPKKADAKADASLTMWRPGFEEPDTRAYEYKGSWSGANIAKWARSGIYGVVNRFFEGEFWSMERTTEWASKLL